MKKNICLILALLLAVSISACSSEDPNQKTIYAVSSTTITYEAGHTLTVNYTFDDNGVPVQAEYIYFVGGSQSATTYTFTCNEYGQITVQTDGTSVTENVYNAEGLLETANIYYEDTLDMTQKYIYENGLNIKMEQYQYGTTLIGVTEYSYNSDGRLTKSVYYDGAGNEISYTLYTYSSDGKTGNGSSYAANGTLIYTQILHYKTVKIPLDSPRTS